MRGTQRKASRIASLFPPRSQGRHRPSPCRVCTARDQALLSQGPSSSRVQYRCASPLRSTHSVPCVLTVPLRRPIRISPSFFPQMASIEVSLSTTPRRKKGGSISGGLTSPAHRNSRDHYKELDALRIALRDKENIIQT